LKSYLVAAKVADKLRYLMPAQSVLSFSNQDSAGLACNCYSNDFRRAGAKQERGRCERSRLSGARTVHAMTAEEGDLTGSAGAVPSLVVVDADNTLWDTNRVYAEAQLELLAAVEARVEERWRRIGSFG
jgi:hypothetical protein